MIEMRNGITFSKKRRYGDKEKRRKGDKSVKRRALSVGRFLFTKPAETLDFVECQVVNIEVLRCGKCRYSLESNEVRERKYRDAASIEVLR